ncbi:MAG: deoxyribose-phosphate aldolase, partial [Gemmatimonadales bacterium]
ERLGVESSAGIGSEVADTAWRMPLVSQSSVRDAGVRTDARKGPGALPTGEVRVADFVDHTLLKAETTKSQIELLCREAREFRFAAVCVNGSWVETCAKLLSGCDVKVAAVVGFPLGAMTTDAKTRETRELIEQGADEIDMVVALGHLFDSDWDYVEDDIRAVVDAAAGRGVKVILEAGALDPMQLVKGCTLAKLAGAAFVKTSTGFHPSGGATAEAVALMRLAVGEELGVKASGGVRDCATALRMIAAGANRIGTSSGVQLVECIGREPVLLKELLRDPDSHEQLCRTGNCPTDY